MVTRLALSTDDDQLHLMQTTRLVLQVESRASQTQRDDDKVLAKWVAQKGPIVFA